MESRGFAYSIDLAKARIHVNRAKNGESSTHPLSGVELRALRQLKRESIVSPFVFVSERGSPFTTAGYRKMIARLGEAARFSFPVHPHMLRHACGYKLANDGRDTRALQHYLGHKSIQHCPLYQVVAGSVPRFLARLSGQRDRNKENACTAFPGRTRAHLGSAEHFASKQRTAPARH
jgi:integrase